MPDLNDSCERSAKYTDLDTVYANCSGPGGLKLTEFIASKLDLKPGTRLLDIGSAWGYQTCFLAKEYGVFAIGIDPWDVPGPEPSVEHVRRMAIPLIKTKATALAPQGANSGPIQRKRNKRADSTRRAGGEQDQLPCPLK